MFYRLTSLFVLSILLLSMGGFYPLFKLEQWNIQKDVKKRMKESLPLKEMDLISVSPQNADEIEWEEEGKEFHYHGQMYDIVYTKKTNDVIHYYCMKDVDESRLFTHLDEMVKKQMDEQGATNGGTSKNLLKIFFSLLYIPSGNIKQDLEKDFSKYNTAYLFLFPSDFIKKFTPPPQIC